MALPAQAAPSWVTLAPNHPGSSPLVCSAGHAESPAAAEQEAKRLVASRLRSDPERIGSVLIVAGSWVQEPSSAYALLGDAADEARLRGYWER